jgi:carboxypeptidase C (cathepsin A)
MMCRRVASIVAGVSGLISVASVASAQAEPERAPVVTQHQIVISGRPLAYTAEVGRIAIRDVETGEPHAYMFYTAYRVASPGKQRPVSFVWNGGPGWPALPLHFEVAGPLRGEGTKLVDNADTWLTESDLVFIDPVGTGFSRATKPEYVKEFALLVGDVMAESEFIRCWLLLHDADDAPVIVAGESYGSSRAGRVGYAVLKRGFNVAGIALISGSTDLPSYPNATITDWAMHVADMAVVGLYFKKTPPELGSTPDAVRATTERWVRDRYLPAVLRVDSLSDQERNAMAVELSNHTGLSPDRIDRKKLILSSQNWLGAFPIDGKRALTADYRRAAPIARPWMPAALRYLRRQLGYRTDLPYIGVDGGETIEQGFAPTGKYPASMNSLWVHSAVYDATPEQFAKAREEFAKAGMLGIPHVGSLPSTPDAIVLNPNLKVLVAQGAYDPLGGCSINTEHARLLPSPYKEAVRYTCYDGAHQMYLDAPARTLFSNDMKSLMRAASAPRPADPRVGLRAGWLDAGEALRNMEMVSHTDRPPGFFSATNPGAFNVMNTDLAFRGNLAFQGSYHGFLIWDIANPARPVLRTSVVCPGGQADLSVYGSLLFMSVEERSARVDCGTQGVRDPISPDRFMGVRIFDITDVDHPRQVAAVQTCRASHTNTLITNPTDTAAVFVYVSGYQPVRSSDELAGCSRESPLTDPNSALFRLEVIRVPLAHPEQARIVSSPRVFNDLAAPPRHSEPDAPAVGGAPTASAPPPTGPSQCHDITTYPAFGLAAGACMGYGFLLDTRDVINPRRIDVAADSNFSFWHSATFGNDGSKVIFTDEWGGGMAPRCRSTDKPEWGADALFTISKGKLLRKGYYKLPAAQTPFENCVAHNGSLVPVPGRDILVQGWYQGGISVVDFTDVSHPREIAFFDRGPIDSAKLVSFAGVWSAYWYNGLIYSSEISRGLDVLRLTPSDQLSINEIEAAKLAHVDQFNAQMQEPLVWPASFSVARAYIDQLNRANGLSALATAGITRDLDAAERLAGEARRMALTKLASKLDGFTRDAREAQRVRALTAAVRRLAARYR